MRAASTAPSAGSPARATVVFTLAMLLALALLWLLRELVLLLYASALFAVLLNPLVAAAQHRRIAGRRLGRGAAIAVVAVGGLVVALLLGRLMLPPLWSEASALALAWPQRSADMLRAFSQSPALSMFDPRQLIPTVSQAGTLILSFAGHLAGFFASAFTVLLLTVYLLAEGQDTLTWALTFVGPTWRTRLAATLDRSQRRMRGWLLGQSMLSGLLTVLSLCLFAALHLPYFYLLALAVGLLSYVPILGPVAGAVLTAAVAAADSWPKMAVVLAFFALYQLADNAYLTPRVMRNAVDVPGLAIILALAIGGSLAGILGALLAVPSAALAAELLHEYGHHQI